MTNFSPLFRINIKAYIFENDRFYYLGLRPQGIYYIHKKVLLTAPTGIAAFLMGV